MSFIDKYRLRSPGSDSAFAVEAIPSPEVVYVSTSEECADLLERAKDAEFVAVRFNPGYFDSIAVKLQSTNYKSQITNHKLQMSDKAQSTKHKSQTEDEVRVFVLRRGETDGFDNALEVLLSGDVKKVGHDVKDIIRVCLERGMDTDGWVFDTALAAYLISPTESSCHYAIARSSERYCGFTPGADSEEGGQMSMLADSGKLFAEEAYALGLLKVALEEKIKKHGYGKAFL
jgi:DNA polymerase-1